MTLKERILWLMDNRCKTSLLVQIMLIYIIPACRMSDDFFDTNSGV